MLTLFLLAGVITMGLVGVAALGLLAGGVLWVTGRSAARGMAPSWHWCDHDLKQGA